MPVLEYRAKIFLTNPVVSQDFFLICALNYRLHNPQLLQQTKGERKRLLVSGQSSELSQ